MITLDRVLKYQKPYRAKTYYAVVVLNTRQRVLRRNFRTATGADLYARRVINRYQRVCSAAAQRVDETQAPGNTTERMPA